MRIVLLSVLLVLSGEISAMCTPYHPVMIWARVIRCNAIHLGPSPSSRWDNGALATHENQNGALHGTLLYVQVHREQAVTMTPASWELAPEEIPEFREDVFPEFSMMFVHGLADAICPETLPADIRMISNPPCCDTYPRTGDCINPFPIVEIESNPDRWREVPEPEKEPMERADDDARETEACKSRPGHRPGKEFPDPYGQ